MRWFVLFLGAAFIGTLAAVVGSRAVAEAQTFVLGIVCGVAASVPASILAFYLARPQAPVAPVEPRQERAYPPVVMVSAPPTARSALAPTFPMPGAADVMLPAPRYRVVGDE